MLAAEIMKVKIVNSSIKGYHIYHVRPHLDIAMDVRPEPENQYDPNAHCVWMPNQENIPKNLLKEVTRPEKESQKKQTAGKIAGKLVGRVPASLGSIFNCVSDAVLSIKCIATVEPEVSKQPVASTKYRYNPWGFSKRGGGATGKVDYVKEQFNQFFANFKGTETLSIED
ncbi:uncharacterized protein LOC130647505 [Hydractinia symbiolongicarpus]|uniref:uncharacterized protein LOC130647505 n=1 Tax=Hydractinia symbiolongicarpus TaxID=13093 RepID=UPI002551A65E|nr:uncharacterized protein LOC130647505 [Hydractinia symbiolongicarpus]